MRRVIKIGTSTALTPHGSIHEQRLSEIATGLRLLIARGDQVVLVVSGAVGLGRSLHPKTPLSHAARQAHAALGQTLLLEAYRTALRPLAAAQLLVTGADFQDPVVSSTFRDTLLHLMAIGAVPLVNANDPITSHQTSIDNDTLAAHVAALWGAEQLVLLSDVDGLYSDNPRTNPNAYRIPVMSWVTPAHLDQFAHGSPGPWGYGGIVSKLRAAQIAQEAGVETILMAGDSPGVWHALASRDYRQATRFQANKEDRHAAGTIS